VARAQEAPRLLDARIAELPPLARWYRTNERAIWGGGSFVVFFLFWEIGARVGLISRFFFASPSAIVATAIDEFQNPRLWNDIRVSSIEVWVGYLLAVVLAVPLGIFAGWYRRFNYFIDPWLNFMNALPRVALLPLIVLWLGIGIWSKVAVVFLGAFFTIIINALYGVRTTDARLLDVAHSFRAAQGRNFTSGELPGSEPVILAGLRLGVGRALIGVIVGELYSANAGVGYMIAVASHSMQIDKLLFGVLLITGMGVVAVELLRLVERRFERWRPKVGAR
jgi:ABC-type nitrate/sulfonate/bicarbonate transport system permease component